MTLRGKITRVCRPSLNLVLLVRGWWQSERRTKAVTTRITFFIILFTYCLENNYKVIVRREYFNRDMNPIKSPIKLNFTISFSSRFSLCLVVNLYCFYAIFDTKEKNSKG